VSVPYVEYRPISKFDKISKYSSTPKVVTEFHQIAYYSFFKEKRLDVQKK